MSEKLDLFIEGKFTKSDTKNWIEVLDPSNQNTLYGTLCYQPEVERAITSAKKLFLHGKKHPPERSRVMMKYQELLKTHQDDIAKILSKENGKTFEDAKGDVWRGIEVGNKPQT